MTSEALAIQALEVLSWDGREWAEYADIEYSYGPTHAAHTYYQSAGTYHQLTGQAPINISTTLMFFNSARSGAFPDEFLWWRDNLRHGERRKLVDPIWGELDAVVVGGLSIKLSSGATSGATIGVRWSTDIADPDEPLTANTLDIDLIATAEAADAQMAENGLAVPVTGDKKKTTLAALMNQVQGYQFLVGAQLDSAVNQALGVLSLTLQLAQSLPTHGAVKLIDNLAALYSATEDLAHKAGLKRPTRTVTLIEATTLGAFAASRGNSDAEIIELNIDALATPIVPKGSTLSYYV